MHNLAKSNPITVLQILPALSSGGVERGTLEVGAYLYANNFRSIVISAGGRMVQQLIDQGSEHVEWSIGKKSILSLKYVYRLRKLLIKEKVDIIHVRSRFPAWIVCLALKGMKSNIKPALITTVHGPYSVSSYSAVMTKGERVIVISEMIREYVMKNYATNEKKLRLIHRGVDSLAFPFGYQPDQSWVQDWYQEYPNTRNKNILVLPARVTKWKGQEDFIDIVALLSNHASNFHAIIVGEVKKDKKKYLKSLERKVKEKKVSNLISFVGHRDDLREIMSISNIVYSLSREPEAFGRTTLEALSLGIPVIGYSHGGVAEQLSSMLPEGKVEVGNIAEATMLTLNWFNRPPTVGLNSDFSLKNMLEKTMYVYKELIQERLSDKKN